MLLPANFGTLSLLPQGKGGYYWNVNCLGVLDWNHLIRVAVLAILLLAQTMAEALKVAEPRPGVVKTKVLSKGWELVFKVHFAFSA